MESFLRRICFIVGTLVMTISSTLAICREGFQTPAPPFYHKLRTHWIAVLGLLLAAIRLVGSLSRSERLIAMYKAVSPFALLPIVYTMVRFVADALSKVEPYSSCLEGFQTPAPPFYHKLRTHWIAVLGLLLAAIRLVGSLSRSKRLIAMYKAVSPFALLPIVYTMVRFVADALSKVVTIILGVQCLNALLGRLLK
ncbi:hypothetical protein MRX96_049461 [Rhipicephalus microplus]